MIAAYAELRSDEAIGFLASLVNQLEPAHLAELAPRANGEDAQRRVAMRRLLELTESAQTCGVVVSENDGLAVFGVCHGGVWGYVSCGTSLALAEIRFIRRIVREEVESRGVLFANPTLDHPRSARWLQLLGFELSEHLTAVNRRPVYVLLK